MRSRSFLGARAVRVEVVPEVQGKVLTESTRPAPLSWVLLDCQLLRGVEQVRKGVGELGIEDCL